MNIFDYAKKLGVETSAENSTLTADQKLKNDAINSSDFEEYANKGLAISNPTRREANGFLGLKTLNWFNFKTGETEVKRFGKEIKNKATYARDVFVNSDKTQIVDTDLFDYTFMNDDEIKIYS